MSGSARRAVLVALVMIELSGSTLIADRGSNGRGITPGDAIGTCFGFTGHKRNGVAGGTRVAS